MAPSKQSERLRIQLGLTGAWMPTSHSSLVGSVGPPRDGLPGAVSVLEYPPDFYFLQWHDRAIIWEELPRPADYRVLAAVRWMAAYAANDHWIWRGVFMGGLTFPTRRHLLDEVSFTNSTSEHTLMQLYPAKVPWEASEP